MLDNAKIGSGAFHAAVGAGAAVIALPLGAVGGAGIGGVANMHADRKAERKQRKSNLQGRDQITIQAPAVTSHHYIAQCSAIGAAGAPLAVLSTFGVSAIRCHRKIGTIQKQAAKAERLAHDSESEAEHATMPNVPEYMRLFDMIGRGGR